MVFASNANWWIRFSDVVASDNTDALDPIISYTVLQHSTFNMYVSTTLRVSPARL